MRMLRRSASFALVLAALTACGESSPTGAGHARPWEQQFTFGNFSINSAPITTNEDGSSANVLSDFVNASALPNADLELFVVHAYLPAGSGVNSRVSNVSVIAQRTDGSLTPNIVRNVTFLERATVGGQQYGIYRLEGMFLGTPALRPANFANVNFVFTADYLDAEGTVVNSSRKTIEVYKRP